jgi:hypothetical protein
MTVSPHEQLSARSIVSRTKASLALKVLEQKGALLLGHRWIDVLDAEFITKQAN